MSINTRMSISKKVIATISLCFAALCFVCLLIIFRDFHERLKRKFYSVPLYAEYYELIEPVLKNNPQINRIYYPTFARDYCFHIGLDIEEDIFAWEIIDNISSLQQESKYLSKEVIVIVLNPLSKKKVKVVVLPSLIGYSPKNGNLFKGVVILNDNEYWSLQTF